MTELAMIFHNHQPVGNFEPTMLNTFKSSYNPFIEVLEKFPSIKITMHFSGPLLVYLKENHSVYIERIKKLINKNQIELLGSGIGEPILTAIPERDRVKQLKSMTELVVELFNYKISGAWVTERVFDANLVKSYIEAGIKYIILDDCHFIKCGIDLNSSGGPYEMITDAGSLIIFKSDSRLRDSMPFENHEKILNWIYKYRMDYGGLLVVGDDGEKFGDWPGMFHHVFGNGKEEGWLFNFFKGIEDYSDDLCCVKLCEKLESPVIQKVYVPSGSYHEMNLWASYGKELKIKSKINKFEEKMLQPANWMNFLYRYSESAILYGKMNLISKEIALIPDEHFRKLAEYELHMAQCNCVYWHGVFGGIYLPHLRMKISEHLISARKIINCYFEEFLNEINKEKPEYSAKKHLDLLRAEYFIYNFKESGLMDAIYNYDIEDVLKGKIVKPYPSFLENDVNLDGVDEILLRRKEMELIFNTEDGGTLISFDNLIKNYDFGNTMSRKQEKYHKDYDGRLDNMEECPPMVYDSLRRSSFRTHFLNKIEMDLFLNNEFEECGDFINNNFETTKLDENNLILERTGRISLNGETEKLKMIKEFKFNDSFFDCDIKYEILENMCEINFAVEMNFMFMSFEGDRYIKFGEENYSLRDPKIFEDKNEIIFYDGYLGTGLKIISEEKCRFYYIPVFTISRNFDKYEAIYQGFSLFIDYGRKHENQSIRVEMINA